MFKRIILSICLLCFLISLGSLSSFAATPVVSAGPYHILAIKADGTLWAWGSTGSGRLGIGPTYVLQQTTPIQVGLDTDWATVAAGRRHSIGIKTDGTLWAWGDNSYGELGNGTTTDSDFPIQVGTDNDWVEVSTAGSHTLALKADGSLWAWGYNFRGQLGNGTTTDSDFPIQVGTSTDWTVVSGGAYHSLAIKTDGTLWAWGYNGYRALGTGANVDVHVPVQVGTDTDWLTVNTEEKHTLAIKTDGTLWTWGTNSDGQLGTGTTLSQSSPVQVGTDSDWFEVSAGRQHSIARKVTDDSIWAWGFNGNGEYGNGTTTDSYVPIQVNTDNDWFTVIAGGPYNMGLKIDGTLWAWGVGAMGQLGNGTLDSSLVPIQVVSFSSQLYPTAVINSPAAGVSINTGDSVDFQGSGTGGNGALNYAWSFPGGTPSSSTEQNPGSVAFDMVGTYLCTLTVTDSDGYTGSDSVTVAVTAVDLYPTAVINSPAAGVSINTGDSVDFQGSGTGGNGALSYAWSFPGGTPSSSTEQNPGSVAFDMVGTYLCTLTVTDSDGYTDSDSVTVAVTAVDLYPTAVINSPAAGVSINTGDSVDFQGSGTGGNGALSYAWSFPDGTPSSSTEQNPGSVAFDMVGTYLCTLTVTDSDGYTDSDSVTVAVTAVDLYPTAVINSPAAGVSINTGDSVDFQGSGTGGNGALNYAWSFPGGTPSSSTEQNPGSVAFDMVGTYICTLTVTDSDGYTGSDSVTVAVTAVDLYPTAVINSPAAGVSINTGDSVDFQGSGTGGNGALSYAWSFPDGTPSSSTEQNPGSVAFDMVGTYLCTLTVTDSDGYTGSDSVVITVRDVSLSGAWVTVSAGPYHILAIKADGTLWAWGSTGSGRLGIGPTYVLQQTTPIQVGLDTDWATVAAGRRHSIGIKTDGTLWAWGDNSYGELGNGTTTDSDVPIQVGTDNDWVEVSTAGSHTLALKADGSLWAWGYNFRGQLGNGTTTDSDFPIQVGTSTDWTVVSGGAYHSLAIKTDGTLWAWGYNGYRALGTGANVDVHVPVQVGTDTDWLTVNTEEKHTLAIKTDDTLWAWGTNSDGQLGTGTTLNQSSPVQVGSDNDWFEVSAGRQHSIARKVTDDSIWAWGFNGNGEYGNGTTTDSYVPIQVNTDNDWFTVIAGGPYNMGLKIDGTLWAWGRGAMGELGNGTLDSSLVPIQVVSFSSQLYPTAVINSPAAGVSINTGDIVDFQGSGTGGNGALSYAWSFPDGTPSSSTEQNPGSVAFDMVGTYLCTLTVTDSDGYTDSDSVTVAVIAVGLYPTAVINSPAAGVSINTGDSVDFQGSGTGGNGALSYAWSFPDGTPSSSTEQNPGSVAFDTVGTYLCTLTVTDSDGYTGSDSVTVAVTAVDLYPTAVINSPAAGASINTGDSVDFQGSGTGGNGALSYAWSFPDGTPSSSTEQNPGSVAFDTVGTYLCTLTVTDSDGYTGSDSVTVAVIAVDLYPTAVINSPAAGASINTGDSVDFQGSGTGGNGALSYVWSFPGGTPSSSTEQNPGSVAFDTVGTYLCTLTVTDSDGYTGSDSVVITVRDVSLSGAWVTVSAGPYHILAIKADGTLWAWGSTGSGRLGIGPTYVLQQTTPIQVGLDTDWATVAAGRRHSIGIKTDGTLWAWGDNSYGELGNGTTTDSDVPIQVGTDNDWVEVSTAGSHTLALKADGSLWAWGFNFRGQLGNGTTTDSDIPIQVGTSTDWTVVSGGAYHSLSIKTDGTLWAWGYNGYRALGTGANVDVHVPVQVGTDTDWLTVNTEEKHTLAIKTDDTLWAWGTNSDGQLGTGTTLNQSSPVQVGTDSDWFEVSAGRQHSIARKVTDDSIWAWGFNGNGEYGNGTTTDSYVPIQVNTDNDWFTVIAGGPYNMGLKIDGTLWAWGRGAMGELGNGTLDSSLVPIQVVSYE